MPRIDEHDAGRETGMAVGDTLELCLGENPTTGYRWYVEWGGEPVSAALDDAYEPSADRPGSGGRRCWRFQAVRAGSALLTVRSRRHWEQGEAQVLSFPVRVTP